MDAKTQIASDMLDSLLDKNLSDVEDLPEWLDFAPSGYYRLLVENVEFKNVDVQEEGKTGKTSAPVVQIVYVVQEVMEQEKPEETPVKIGAKFNESFFFHKDPEKSMAVIKAKFKAIAEAAGISNVKELLAYLKGMEIGATVKSKKDATKDRYYISTSNAQKL